MKKRLNLLLICMLSLLLYMNNISLAENKGDVFAFCPQDESVFVLSDGRYVLCDIDGNRLNDNTFENVWFFDASGQATVSAVGKLGRINRSGDYVFTPIECDDMLLLEDESGHQLLQIRYDDNQTEQYQVMTTEGRLICNQFFDEVLFFENGCLLVENEGKYNIIDENGDYLSTIWFDNYTRNSNGLFFLSQADEDKSFYFMPLGNCIGMNYLDQTGNTTRCIVRDGMMVAHPENWDYIGWLSSTYLCFHQNGRVGVADYNYNEIISAEYTSDPILVDIKNGIYCANTMDDIGEMSVLFDLKGNKYLQFTPEEKIGNIIKEKGLMVLYGKRGGRIVNSMGTTLYTFSAGFYVEKCDGAKEFFYYDDINGQWGFIDNNGNILCEYPNTISQTGELISDWIATNNNNGSFSSLCYVNTTGTILQNCDWIELYPFSGNGKAFVKTADGIGVIDETGAYVVEPKYTTCEDYFQTGDQWLAYVADSTGWGYINNDGELICWNRKRTSVKGTTDISLRNANGGVLLSIPEGKEFILHGYDEKLGMFSATYGETEGYVKGTGLMIFRNGNWQAITKDELIERTK